MLYLCPTHNVHFQTPVSTPPGETGQPSGCHDDCPLGKREREGPKVLSRQMLIAQAREKGVSFDKAAQEAVAAGYTIEE